MILIPMVSKRDKNQPGMNFQFPQMHVTQFQIFFGQLFTPRPNQEGLDAFQAWSLHPWCACSASSDKISCSWTHGTIICIMMTYHVKILDIMLFIYGAFIELISCKLVLSTNKGHSDLDLGSAPWCSHMHLPYSYSLESEVRSHWHNGMNQDFVLKILKFWKYFHSSELEFLPVYHPSEEEKADPQVRWTTTSKIGDMSSADNGRESFYRDIKISSCMQTTFAPWWLQSWKCLSAPSPLLRPKKSLEAESPDS